MRVTIESDEAVTLAIIDIDDLTCRGVKWPQYEVLFPPGTEWSGRSGGANVDACTRQVVEEVCALRWAATHGTPSYLTPYTDEEKARISGEQEAAW